MLFSSVGRSWQGVPAIDWVLLTPVMIVKASARCICPFRCFPCSLAFFPVPEQRPSAVPCLRACVLEEDSGCALSHSHCLPLTEYASCGCGPRYRTFVPKVVQLENKQILKLPYRVGMCWLVYLKFASY